LLILLLHQEEEIVEVAAAAVVLSQAPPIGFLSKNSGNGPEFFACIIMAQEYLSFP
jgi:hypothetical protein